MQSTRSGHQTAGVNLCAYAVTARVALAESPPHHIMLTPERRAAVRSVLVANNGLAAVKFIRSIRSWAYKTFGNERAVALVAMATPEDMRIDAEHIRMADQVRRVCQGAAALPRSWSQA